MKKFFQLVISVMLLGMSCSYCFAKYDQNECIANYTDKIPGIGLILEEIKFDGITIKNFHFENNKKYIFVKCDQKFDVYFDYEVDASKLKTLHLHHLIIGLHKDGPQKCVLDSLGIKNSQGKAKISLVSPEKIGAYQVRFCLSEGLTSEQAMKAWWKEEGPSAKTIVGIVITK